MGGSQKLGAGGGAAVGGGRRGGTFLEILGGGGVPLPDGDEACEGPDRNLSGGEWQRGKMFGCVLGDWDSSPARRT